jgi:NADH-quinone oxidoreductase subunit C
MTPTIGAEMPVERVLPEALRDRLIALKRQGYTMLLDIGGVDYPDRAERFEVVYHLLALPARIASIEEVGRPQRRRLIVPVGGERPSVPSIVDLWPAADWAEREVYDLFGVLFDGHPDLRRVQMPIEWEGHPLRKDYPVRGPSTEATPLPEFASKSNVPASTPPSGRVA